MPLARGLSAQSGTPLKRCCCYCYAVICSYRVALTNCLGAGAACTTAKQLETNPLREFDAEHGSQSSYTKFRNKLNEQGTSVNRLLRIERCSGLEVWSEVGRECRTAVHNLIAAVDVNSSNLLLIDSILV